MASWADRCIAELREGKTTSCRPRGRSMEPLVFSGALVHLEPIGGKEIRIGEIVLVRVKGNVYLHLIKAREGNRYQIGNNRGRINGWVGPAAVYGRVNKIDNPK